MSNVQTFQASGSDLCYVIATADSRLLPKLREALEPMHPRSIVVSAAVSWSDLGTGITYRGQSLRLDLQVARVEILCSERQVDAIVGVINKLLVPEGHADRAEGTVAAFAAGGTRIAPATQAR